MSYSSNRYPGRAEYMREYMRKRRLDGKGLYPEKNKEYYIKNKDAIRARVRVSEALNKAINPFYKLKVNTRSLLSTTFKRAANGNYKKGRKTEEMLGCTVKYFSEVYMPSLLKDGMTMENYGKVWHIDHILPVSIAQTAEDIQKLNHFKNLRPEFSSTNLRKGDSILPEFYYLFAELDLSHLAA